MTYSDLQEALRVLGLAERVTMKDIKARHRALVKQHHPDTNATTEPEVIIANATLSFGRNALKGWKAFVIAGIATGLFGLNVHPIFVILLAALIGLVLFKPKQSNPNHPASVAQNSTSTKPLLLILSVSIIGFLLLFIFNRALFDLAILMFRIDLFAFGGGFASVPLMFHEIVEIGWIARHL